MPVFALPHEASPYLSLSTVSRRPFFSPQGWSLKFRCINLSELDPSRGLVFSSPLSSCFFLLYSFSFLSLFRLISHTYSTWRQNSLRRALTSSVHFFFPFYFSQPLFPQPHPTPHLDFFPLSISCLEPRLFWYSLLTIPVKLPHFSLSF